MARKNKSAVPSVTAIIVDTGDLFTAHLSNGSARIMMRAKVGLDVSPTHALYAEIIAQTSESIEGFFDSLVERALIDARALR
ncbi:MAG: hypothetical protein E6Q97_16995 [Desulfurellales bacterium]|nr:MAG: hypothetical protein E6Q97_16995 [Desulfurellales bacterium]